MKHKFLYLRKVVLLVFMIVLFSHALVAQKKPLAVNLDTNSDDSELCLGKIKNSQFCKLFNKYEANKDGNDVGKLIAKNARNEMIYIVQGQIDSFYKFRKDSRSTKIRVFQTILDFLLIGGDLAVAIMNGERAKTIIGAASGSIETGAVKFNKNFQVLQTQVLINNMNAKRAQILTEILVQTNKPINADLTQDAYTWYQAKNDLRNYLLAGTFDDALDTLVEESSAKVVKAEAILKAVSKKDVVDARCANNTLADLDAALKSKDADVVTKANEQLQTITSNLLKNSDIAPSLADKKITKSSTGREIWDALFTIRGDLAIAGKTDLVIIINQAIAENCKL